MGAPRQLPSGSAAPPHAAPDEAPSVGRSANLSSEEMREYQEQRRYMLARVGSTWMFGSGN